MKNSILTMLFALHLAACGTLVSDLSIDDAIDTSAHELTAGDATDTDAEGLEPVDSENSGSDDSIDDEGPKSFLKTCDFGFLKSHILNKYDANKNQSIDPEEEASFAEEYGSKDSEVDTSIESIKDGEKKQRNGRVGKGKRPRAIRHGMRHHRRMKLKLCYDRNSDLVLDADERSLLRDDLKIRCENVKAIFDADSDGVLSAEEFYTLKEARKNRIQKHRQKMKSKCDTNTDDSIDEVERYECYQDAKEKRHTKKDDVLSMSEQERAEFFDSCSSKTRGEHLGAPMDETQNTEAETPEAI